MTPSPTVLERAKAVRLVVFDVDGVMTDGRLYLGSDGQELKVFHARDGQGLVMLRDSNVHIGIISGRSSAAVAERMHALGIEHVYQGVADKLPVFRHILEALGLEATQAAYVGDDLPDVPVLRAAGLAIAVADAHELARQHAHWQTCANGGCGAVREICDLILGVSGKLQPYQARFLMP